MLHTLMASGFLKMQTKAANESKQEQYCARPHLGSRDEIVPAICVGVVLHFEGECWEGLQKQPMDVEVSSTRLQDATETKSVISCPKINTNANYYAANQQAISPTLILYCQRRTVREADAQLSTTIICALPIFV